VVPGERAFQFACRLGVPPRRIRRGLYGLDVAGLSVAAEQRPDPWPRRFLFLGRYSHEKDPQTLVKAYQLYRQRFGDASWSLHTHGTGPLATVFEGQAGIVNGGFQQPDKLPASLAQAGAMVLPSRFEPWGVAIAEACAAGLPVVVSEACGASVELVRPHYNGLTFEAGDAAGLARALERIHRLGDAGELATWGRRSRQIVDPFAADRWVDRWTALTHEALDAPDTSAS
jgi:glycosyltransferase involved in cell wall biosynthesis